jgi:hypothetical protein
LDNASRKAEARFFALSTLRELDRDDEFVAATRALVDEFPDSSWSEEALNNLGTYYILMNEDDFAAKSFRELYEKFPSGIRANARLNTGGIDRTGDYPETIRVFESAATAFNRSDYRPSFLCWAARARQGRQRPASRRASPAGADRLRELARATGEREADAASERASTPYCEQAGGAIAATASAIPTERLIRLLLSGLADDAINELRFAQPAGRPSTPVTPRSRGCAPQRRPSTRDYPDAAGLSPAHDVSGTGAAAGDPGHFPAHVLGLDQVLDPQGLDPYMIAADRAGVHLRSKIRSPPTPETLMQVVPAKGRQLARTLGYPFQDPDADEPEINIRLGTLYSHAWWNNSGGRIMPWRATMPARTGWSAGRRGVGARSRRVHRRHSVS